MISSAAYFDQKLTWFGKRGPGIYLASKTKFALDFYCPDGYDSRLFLILIKTYAGQNEVCEVPADCAD